MRFALGPLATFLVTHDVLDAESSPGYPILPLPGTYPRRACLPVLGLCGPSRSQLPWPFNTCFLSSFRMSRSPPSTIVVSILIDWCIDSLAPYSATASTSRNASRWCSCRRDTISRRSSEVASPRSPSSYTRVSPHGQGHVRILGATRYHAPGRDVRLGWAGRERWARALHRRREE